MTRIYRGYRIRDRHRRGRPKEAGGAHVEWHEWQVIGPRGIVLGRFDFEEQAKRFIDAAVEAGRVSDARP